MIHQCHEQFKFLLSGHLKSTDDYPRRALALLSKARDEQRKTRTAETKE